jgi:hypothetical protein
VRRDALHSSLPSFRKSGTLSRRATQRAQQY